MNGILWLLRKELVIDWRSRYPVAGILLYIAALVITCYFAFTGYLQDETWNAVLWLVVLFIATNAVAKSFTQEDNRAHYYFYLLRPEQIILAKLVYYLLYQWLLVLVALAVFSLMLGLPSFHFGLFLLNLLTGALGLSAVFTLIAAIAAKTSNHAVMMAILGFPVIIPILLLSISNSRIIVLGGAWNDIAGNFLTLLSVNVVIIVLSFILFPFIWKS